MVKKFISELVGTMLLVIFGCGTAVALFKVFVVGSANYDATAVAQARMIYCGILIALAFGLILMALVYTIGKVSGSHVNPAVSLACLIDGRMKLLDFVYYVVAQVLGGILGAAVLSWLFGGTTLLGANGYEAASVLGKTITAPIAFVVEAILTFVFVLVILSVTKKDSKANGMIIGLTLALVHIFGLPFTGTSVNPARSIGPAIFTKGDALSQLWLFILAPLVGAALAALFYRFVIAEKEEEVFEEVEVAAKPVRKTVRKAK